MAREEKRKKRRKRLRKQPRVRRVNAAVSMEMPRTRVPATASRRRKRNTQRFRLPAGVKRVLLSTRWASLLLLALTAGTLAFVGAHEDFYITFIPVDGVASISPEQIVGASGLAGAHVFSVDPAEAADRITDLPGVISATVDLKWPNVVQVQIREEMPIAIWVQDNAQYWVNQEGALLPARIPVVGLLVIEAEGDSAFVARADSPDLERLEEQDVEQVEKLPYLPPEVLAGALQLQQLRPSLTTLFYDPSGGLSFQDGDGWRVYFGTGNNMPGKMVVYEAIVSDLLSRNLTLEYVSVANHEKPYYRAQEREDSG